MGIVKISDLMHDNLRTASDALSRSINSQAEHWMRVGMLSELHPGLSYAGICQLMLSAARHGEELAYAPPELAAAASTVARKAIRKAAR